MGFIEAKKIKKWVKENRAALIVFAIYLAVTFVAVLFHENWEDEAQAWLTARDCSPIELVGRMGVEGHFLPWYLILMPFAKLGFPYITTNIISWLITASAAWLMLKHLPCKFYKRIIFIFMLPMIYLYPAISRCYCLLPLGTILAIMFYKDRFKKPLRYLFSILIIANVHTYTFMFALVMGMEYLIDWIKYRKELDDEQNKLIMCGIAGIVILVIAMYIPLLGSVGVSGSIASAIGLTTYSDSLKHLFISTPIRFFAYFSLDSMKSFIYFMASFLIVWEFFTRKTEFFKIALAIIWQFAICCFVFDTIIPQRPAIIVFIILFFIACRTWREKENSSPVDMWSIKNVLLDLVFTAINIWIEIKTGNKNLAFLTLFTIMLIIILIYIKTKRPSLKEKFYVVGRRVAKILLVCLALIQVWLGLCQIIDEIKLPYTDAAVTADFVNNNIPDNSILLTSQNPNMLFVAVIPYLNSQHERVYSIGEDSFYTFAIQPTPSAMMWIDPNSINWAKYCSYDKELYYLNISEQLYEDGNIFDMNNASTIPTSDLEWDDVLEKIFDIREGMAATEHYAIYKVSSEACRNK